MAQKCNTYIPYRKGKLWGYSDTEGKIMIQPKFDKVDFFGNDFAKVYKLRDNNIIRQSIIDTLGHLFVPLRYESTFQAANIHFILYSQFKKENRFGTTEEYKNYFAKRVPQVKNSLYIVIDTLRKWALFDSKTQTQITKSDYNSIDYLTYKNRTLLFKTEINGKFGIIDQNGKVIEKCENSYVYIVDGSNNQDSIILVKPNREDVIGVGGVEDISEEDEIINDSGSKKYGQKDYSGNYIVKPIYDTLFKFGYSNYLVAKKDGKFGIILNDKITIPLMYDSIIYYSYTNKNRESKNKLLAIVKVKSKYGIVNENNQYVVPIEFDSIVKVGSTALQPYSIYPTLMKKNGKWGMYDDEFKIVVPHLYDGIGEGRFHNREHTDYECVVKKSDKWGVVDENDNEVFPFIFDDIIRIVPYMNYGVVLISKPHNYYSGIYFRDSPEKSVFDSKGMIEFRDSNDYKYHCRKKENFVVIKINKTGKEEDAYFMNNSGFSYCSDN